MITVRNINRINYCSYMVSQSPIYTVSITYLNRSNAYSCNSYIFYCLASICDPDHLCFRQTTYEDINGPGGTIYAIILGLAGSLIYPDQISHYRVEKLEMKLPHDHEQYMRPPRKFQDLLSIQNKVVAIPPILPSKCSSELCKDHSKGCNKCISQQ